MDKRFIVDDKGCIATAHLLFTDNFTKTICELRMFYFIKLILIEPKTYREISVYK